jgi:predicted RNase H-related nuclease YkuK (DUF458 family)
MEPKFMSSFGIPLSPQAVVQAIVDFMQLDQTAEYKITIGSDSEKKRGGADFVTAIVVHRVGNGGRYFWRRIVSQKKFHTIRDRIVDEVLLSLDTAKNLITATEALNLPAFNFEIHVDVGENGDTRTMIQELVGMIRAHNFEARTKPESYAASKVADRHT